LQWGESAAIASETPGWPFLSCRCGFSPQ
jgi:hypothetical protein